MRLSRPEVLGDDVEALCEPPEEIEPRVGLEVESDTRLAEVVAHEGRARVAAVAKTRQCITLWKTSHGSTESYF